MQREELINLNEDRLRTDVLLPLFTAMGFKDVFHYHGGAQEQGKDIVLWKPDLLRERLNHGVVVKAEKITGAADVGELTLSRRKSSWMSCTLPNAALEYGE